MAGLQGEVLLTDVPLTEQLFDVPGIETLAKLLENRERRFKPLASWFQLPFQV